MTTSGLTPTQFTDLQGTVWDATITVGSAKRVDSVDYSVLTSHKVSLLRGEDLQGLLGELITNTGFLFAMLFDIMWSQVGKNLSVDPVIHRAAAELEFSERMGGAQIESARKALWGALQDFFPHQKTALQKSLNGFESSLIQLEKEMNELEPEAMQLLQERTSMEFQRIRKELLDEIRGGTSAKLPQ